jgi:hypothetical protein
LYRPTRKSPRKQEAPRRKSPPKDPSPPPSIYDDERDEEYAASLRSLSSSQSRSPSPPPPPSKGKGKGKGKTTRAPKAKKDKGPEKEKEKEKERASLRTETMAYVSESDEEDEETRERDDGPEASPTGKKVFKSWALSEHWEPIAMEYLRAHDILWDKSHKDHANKDLKKAAWEDFSTAMEGTYSG